jgi:uncharacterized membrane protein
MKPVLAVFAAMLVGGALGAGGGGPLGLVVGVLALWAGWRLQQLGARLDVVERRLAEREAELARLRASDVAARRASASGASGVAQPEAGASPAAPAAALQPSAVSSTATLRPPSPPASGPATTKSAWGPADGSTPVGDPAPAPAGWAPPGADPSSPPALAPLAALLGGIRDWFMGGNTLVRVGVVVLFFGVAFLLRYVAERTELPIEFRLAGVALGAIVLLGLGWRLRRRRPGYALTLQGGAVGILYLTVFAALRLYALLSPAAAFALLVLVTVFAVALAVLQDSLAFALVSALGAFLAPILASSGPGDHVTLFGYYLVLTAGLVGIAWFKAWRPLMLLGFVATFVVATAWGVLRYRADLFASTEPFLVLFFLAYVAIAVLFALRQAPDLKGYVDGTLVFGPPVAAFALQSAMLHDARFRLAFSALCVGGLYVGLAALLWRRHRGTLRLLVESFLALGIAFLTLAIPLAIDGHWTAATWALEGAALLWVGCRQDRRLARASGVLLQWAAGLVFWRGLDLPAQAWPLLNSQWLGGAMVAGAALVSARMLARARPSLRDYEWPVAGVMFTWGLGWWVLSGLAELDRLLAGTTMPAAATAFLATTAWLSSELQRRVAMPLAQWPAWLLAPALALMALVTIGASDHPLAAGGWWAWPLAFAILYWLLRRHADAPLLPSPDGSPAPGDDAGETASPLAAALLHTFAAWTALALLGTEFAWQVQRVVAGGADWVAVAGALVPLVALLALPGARARAPWPFARHELAYAGFAAGGVALYLGLWLLGAQLRAGGDSAPLAYVPLLNPIDLASGLIVLALLRHWLVLRATLPALVAGWNEHAIYGTLAALGFAWLNGALLRAVHHYGAVPYEAGALLGSTLVQVSLSIFWAALALGIMLLATRRAYRLGWLVGAALLAVVVAKLFLVDLSRVGSIERIVSFVVVGGLMLVIGWFSPLPPAESRDASADAVPMPPPPHTPAAAPESAT